MYQLVILDALGGRDAILQSTLKQRIGDLNLDATAEIEFLGPDQLGSLRDDSLCVGVLFTDSDAGQKFTQQVELLLARPAVVIPAVLSLEDFPNKVPEALRPTN